MSIQEQLVTLLSGQTDAATRIYPMVAPTGTAKPYIVYQRISAISETVLSGDSGLTNTRMQIDVYADTYQSAQHTADQIEALMAGWSVQNVSVLAQDLYEDAVQLHRVQADFSIWHS